MTDPSLIAALATHGLILRGGFAFAAGDDAPVGPSGGPARSVVLVGQAGAAPWPHFQKWREGKAAEQKNPLDSWAREAEQKNPLDSWAREVIGAVADKFGARAVSPSDRPYLPFQQWAMRAEGLKPSPLGILMHPEYGLWHAYRGALLFDDERLAGELLAEKEAHESIHLCDACVGKPCKKACPVDAHSGDGFDYEDCLAHVRGPEGGACRDTGCLDRNACPYGAKYRYPAEVQAFHMAAFAGVADVR